MSTSPKLADKAEEIRRILSEPTVDLWRLRELASTEGGLVNGESRAEQSSICWARHEIGGGDGWLIENVRDGEYRESCDRLLWVAC